MTGEIQPGLLVLHGNRAELLGEAVFAWLRRHPLQPLEEEVLLVQSNGMAEWLKMALATQAGVCAATRVELPARFLWRAYRQVLGRAAVPALSALDKQPLTWRLMQTLPRLLQRPGFEPLAGFLARGGMDRRLQLAQRLADLYDQYQVYRSDWLAAWAAGHDVLPAVAGQPLAGAPPLPPDQAWQAALWRELLLPLGAAQQAGARGALHQRFVAALQAQQAPAAPLARRVVLFGMTHLPLQTLQALAALSRHCQVLLAVPNPCRFHWADIIDGRELLRLQRRRHPLRDGRDLAALPLQDLHAHAHPLLAAWGRQGRDFVRQLDDFDDAQAALQRFALPRVDLFDEGPGQTLLQQVQARIRDLVPLGETPEGEANIDAADRSIVFHIAHSAQREVEILHDQLLALLAQAPAPGTQRRCSRATSSSWCPTSRASHPPSARCLARSRVLTPGTSLRHCRPARPPPQPDAGGAGMAAAAAAAALPPERAARPAGRAGHRGALRPGRRRPATPCSSGWRAPACAGACMPSSASLAGPGRLRRHQHLGLRPAPHAAGVRQPARHGRRPGAKSQPYAEVGGLDAALAGSLAAMLDALAPLVAGRRHTGHAGRVWPSVCVAAGEPSSAPPTSPTARPWRRCTTPCGAGWTPASTAGFADAVPLAVAREAWLSGVDEPGLNRRFRAGGVTFCTLLPMRAIPFEVLCLLGMNDGDYPRRRRAATST
jgi:exodeoxyribonuclease V gamma subunit